MTATTTTTTPAVLVRSLFEAFGRGDIPFILSHVSADCRWVCPGGEGIPSAGVYKGPEGAAQFFQKLGESEEFLRFEPREYFESGNSVVALGMEETRSRQTGKTGSTNWSMLFRLRGDQVIEWESFFDTAASVRMHSA